MIERGFHFMGLYGIGIAMHLADAKGSRSPVIDLRGRNEQSRMTIYGGGGKEGKGEPGTVSFEVAPCIRK